jgi:hypothetical protein
MLPPQAHLHLEFLVSAFLFAIFTLLEPGFHGPGITGIQGMGVSTPIAAEVAADTVGLDMDLHIPKGGILTIGILSITVAAGNLSANVLLMGGTMRVLGVRP